MSQPQWTPNQQNAIDARGMQILVSAAAGSGKTAVLTERVKNILTDTHNPCGVDNILVVTFTRAAAGEMRDRIYKALKEASADNNNSDYLREQMLSLPLADICTMDSFCQKIVKENFSKAGVSADYTLLDEKELDEMTQSALDKVIGELYEENDESFIKLTSMFLSERDDGKLSEIIDGLYRYSRSYPSPENWLDSVAESFSPDKTPNETVWADVVYNHIELFSDFHRKRLMRAVSMMEESGNFSPAFIQRFTVSAEKLSSLNESAKNRNWDAVVSIIREGLIFNCPARNSKVDAFVKDLATDVFNSFKQDVEGIEGLNLPTVQEHKSDCKHLEPIVKKLCQAVKMLEKELGNSKKERNAYSFDDILHKCIDLLVVFDGDSWSRTPLADELQEKYKEIFIDEYQDTNHAQNIIFEALSKNCTNLYCVGDVKQSIYKFRLASPQLFMDLRKRLPDYNGQNKPSQITLDRNFRSRVGITQVTNHVFTSLMSEAVGEIDYNEREELVFGADYYQAKDTPDVELLCLDYSESNSADATLLEAEQVAGYIKNLIRSGVQVTTKSGERPIESSDICILLRNMKRKAHIYANALENIGISANTVLDGDTSLSKEVQLLVSLIKVINNPLMDIPLIAVLFSSVFGFTADELAKIRMIDRNAELYVCLEKYAENSDKAKYFLNKLSLYRNVAASHPINEFVKFVVKDTDIENVYLAADNGESRKANIRGFIDFAEKFTENGRAGLGSFVRSIDNAVKSQKMHSYSGVSSPGGVQIMSIHKSKGLEFPFVIVADCSADFNKRDAYNPLKISRVTGVGLKIRDDEKFTTYNTVSSVAAEKDILYGVASEELRVMYVAMTRAKEHLTFVCSFKSRDGLKKKIRLNNYFSFDVNGKVHPYAVYKAKSMSEWLLTCFSQHHNCQIVRELCEIPISENYITSYSMDESPHTDYFTVQSNNFDDEEYPADENILSSLAEKSSFEYKYDCSGILAKRTASSTEKHTDSRKYFAQRKPQFLNAQFTGADRGTAIHKFLELCDLKSAANDLEKEKAQLLSSGKMTEKELSALDNASVASFFNSAVGQRLLNADEIKKEYEFSFLMKACELYDDISPEIADEKIVIQGKLDCAFVEKGNVVLIDYKSDSIDDADTFRRIYTPQLDIYTRAIEECTDYKVTERYIYSFKLKEFIKI